MYIFIILQKINLILHNSYYSYLKKTTEQLLFCQTVKAKHYALHSGLNKLNYSHHLVNNTYSFTFKYTKLYLHPSNFHNELSELSILFYSEKNKKQVHLDKK